MISVAMETRDRVFTFRGGYEGQMDYLTELGYEPMTTAQLMRYRLDSLHNDNESGVLKTYHSTPDTLWISRDGKALIELNSSTMKTAMTQILRGYECDGAITGGDFDEIKRSADYAIEIPLNKFEIPISNSPPTTEKILNSKIWRALAGDDKHLLQEYVYAFIGNANTRNDLIGHYMQLRTLLPHGKSHPNVLATGYPLYLGAFDELSEIRATPLHRDAVFVGVKKELVEASSD